MIELTELTNSIFLMKQKRKYAPYRKQENGQLNPIRGRNKNGVLVWRSYKSIEEAKENLNLNTGE